MTLTRMFVGGDWRAALDGAEDRAFSPATGEDLGPVARGDRADAQAAIAAAQKAYPGWAAETAFGRAAALHRVADVCERRREELARACTLDQGKPLHAESYDEVDELIAMWRAAAEDGIRLEGSIPNSSTPGARVLLMRRPLGVVAVVTPWNWPYTMPAEIVAPALATGNTVVWTPAPSTTVCSGLLAECVAEADLPPGVFNFVLGPGPVVGDELVSNPGTAAVGFIGSTATGRRIAERAAGKALLLEMGGNGPLVVLDGADVDAAAEAAITACFLCAGQSCTAGERLLVDERVRDEFVEKLAGKTAAGVRLGDPFAAETTMGPLNNEPVAAKMDAHVADAVQRGATVVTGGHRHKLGGTFFEPTILANVPNDAIIFREETFGPVAPLFRFKSEEEAIQLANDTEFGLASYFYARDIGRIFRVAEALEYGIIGINEGIISTEVAPFGGMKSSGLGREGSK